MNWPHGALVDVFRLPGEGPGGGERPALYVGDWRRSSVLGYPQLVQPQLCSPPHPGGLCEGVDITGVILVYQLKIYYRTKSGVYFVRTKNTIFRGREIFTPIKHLYFLKLIAVFGVAFAQSVLVVR